MPIRVLLVAIALAAAACTGRGRSSVSPAAPAGALPSPAPVELHSSLCSAVNGFFAAFIIARGRPTMGDKESKRILATAEEGLDDLALDLADAGFVKEAKAAREVAAHAGAYVEAIGDDSTSGSSDLVQRQEELAEIRKEFTPALNVLFDSLGSCQNAEA